MNAALQLPSARRRHMLGLKSEHVAKTPRYHRLIPKHTHAGHISITLLCCCFALPRFVLLCCCLALVRFALLLVSFALLSIALLCCCLLWLAWLRFAAALRCAALLCCCFALRCFALLLRCGALLCFAAALLCFALLWRTAESTGQNERRIAKRMRKNMWPIQRVQQTYMRIAGSPRLLVGKGCTAENLASERSERNGDAHATSL